MLPSQVSNREPGVYTAQEKTKGVHLAPEARRKRAASKAFEHVINVRTDYGRFRTRIFYACGVTCAARKIVYTWIVLFVLLDVVPILVPILVLPYQGSDTVISALQVVPK